MLTKKTFTYTDYNGNVRTEDAYFEINESELVMLQLSVSGGIQNYMERISQAQDFPSLAELFRKIIRLAYGEKSDDGRYLMKSDAICDRFEHSPVYNQLFMELMDADKAIAFIKAVLPESVSEEIAKADIQGGQVAGQVSLASAT